MKPARHNVLEMRERMKDYCAKWFPEHYSRSPLLRKGEPDYVCMGIDGIEILCSVSSDVPYKVAERWLKKTNRNIHCMHVDFPIYTFLVSLHVPGEGYAEGSFHAEGYHNAMNFLHQFVWALDFWKGMRPNKRWTRDEFCQRWTQFLDENQHRQGNLEEKITKYLARYDRKMQIRKLRQEAKEGLNK